MIRIESERGLVEYTCTGAHYSPERDRAREPALRRQRVRIAGTEIVMATRPYGGKRASLFQGNLGTMLGEDQLGPLDLDRIDRGGSFGVNIRLEEHR